MDFPTLSMSQSPVVSQGRSNQLTNSSSLIQPHPENLQSIVIVGGGAAAAQVLQEMNRLNASEKKPYTGQISVVANMDAWNPSQRGAGFINHQNELIAHYGARVPGYDVSYVDRATFSKTNEAIIQQAVEKGAFRIRSEVVKITRLADGNFRLYFSEGNPVDTKRVVLATGLGRDMTLFDPPDLSGGRTSLQKKMQNMRFLNQEVLKQQGRTMTGTELSIELDKNPDQFKGKRFVFQGAFVTVDAVEKLKATLGDQVDIVAWLVRESAPNLLDGNHLKYAPAVSRDHTVFVREVEVSPCLSDDQRIGVEVNIELNTCDIPGESQKKKLIADYYVYSLGSDPELPGSGQSILGDLSRELVPLYDVNQTISTNPYETVFGLGIGGINAGQGLTIVGAAATALAANVKHSYLDQVEADLTDDAKSIHPKLGEQLAAVLKHKLPPDELIDELNGLVQAYTDQLGTKLGLFNVLKQNLNRYVEARRHFLPEIGSPEASSQKAPTVAQAMNHVNTTQVASVVNSAQLCTVRAAIAGLSATIAPHNVNGEINYSVDNRTQMRVAIAQRYEQIRDLPQHSVEKFIADVIRLRHFKSSEFVEYASSEVFEQEVMPLIFSSWPIDEIIGNLKQLKISPNTCEKCQNHLLFARENFIGVSLSPDLITDLKSDLMVAFNAGPKPVHGVPERVRAGYENYLGELQNAKIKNTSIAKYWLM